VGGGPATRHEQPAQQKKRSQRANSHP
jgi:hypothetical protein